MRGKATSYSAPQAPEAEERRKTVFTRMRMNASIAPDVIGLGPKTSAGERTRRLTLGLD